LPTGFLKYLENVGFLQLDEDCDILNSGLFGLLDVIEPIQDLQSTSLVDDYRPRDGAFQRSHGAWPVVIL